MSNPSRPLNENAKKAENFPSATIPDYLDSLVQRGNGATSVEVLKDGAFVTLTVHDGRRAAEELEERLKRGTKSLESMQAVLDKLDMDPALSFAVPLESTVSPYYLGKSGRLARAADGGKGFDKRVRSKLAYSLAQEVWKCLPSEDRVSVRYKVERTISVSGNPEHTLGRLLQYYPLRGAQMPTKPPTQLEVDMAMRSCGLTVFSERQQLTTLRLAEEELELPGFDVVKVNPKASNGLPVMGRWCDPEARAKVLGLANKLASVIEAAHQKDAKGGVTSLVRTWHRTNPEQVAVLGKCKEDYYPIDKVLAQRLRFYNVFPRHLMLLMQQATQVLEAHARNAFTHRELLETLPSSCRTLIATENHSAQGTYLNKGGAARLVAALDRQLDEHAEAAARRAEKFPGCPPTPTAVAYLHAGDDSWVAVRDGESIICFALDCSSFDLTQHSAVTAPVHLALRKEMEKLARHPSLYSDNLSGGAAAALWYSFMRERLTVVAGTLVRVMKHGGPSGAPLQSKVNDLLMEILLRRLGAVLALRPVGWSNEPSAEASVNDAIMKEGKRLGFVVRVEQYRKVSGRTVQEFLRHEEFTFLGYNFHNRQEPLEVGVRDGAPLLHVPGVVAYVDLPRNLAQLPYPNIKWTRHAGELRMTEAMRLGSIASNLGVPPARLDAAFEAYRREAYLLLRSLNTVLALNGRGEEAEPRDALRWAISDNPLVGLVSPSLRGLEDYLYQRKFHESWMPGCRGLAIPGVPAYSLVTPSGQAQTPLAWEDVENQEAVLEAIALPDEQSDKARRPVIRYTVDQLLSLKPASAAQPPNAIAAAIHVDKRPTAFSLAPPAQLLVRAPDGRESMVPSVTTVRPPTAKNDGRPPPTATQTRAEIAAGKRQRSRGQAGGGRATQARHYAADKAEEEGRDTRQQEKRRRHKSRK